MKEDRNLERNTHDEFCKTELKVEGNTMRISREQRLGEGEKATSHKPQAAGCKMRDIPVMFLAGFVLMLFGVVSNAGSPGSTGANFLKIGMGARAIGMGEVFCGVANDVSSLYWNPAGLSELTQQEANFIHTEWFEGVRYEYLSYGYPSWRYGNFGGSISYLSIDDIQGYDEQGVKSGKKRASDFSLGMGYSWQLREELSIGGGLKIIQERLADEEASGMGLDVGVLYVPGIDLYGGKIRLGGTLQNVGMGLKFIEEAAALPTLLRLGAAYSHLVMGKELISGLDIEVPRDNEMNMRIGIEYKVMELLSLRLGYRGGQDIGSGIRFGFGVDTGNVGIDYAYGGYGDLGDTHRVSVGVKFGPRVKESREVMESYRLGLEYFEEGKYPEAIIEFNEVLEKNPEHREALEMMKKANEMMVAE